MATSPNPKVISLSVSAFQRGLLCFEVNGILGELNVELGDKVSAYNLPNFYALLGSIPLAAGQAARLKYDFPQIDSDLERFTLARLRAESARASLNKAINARANAYYGKYANATNVIARTRAYYSDGVAGTKPTELMTLASFSDQQFQEINDAYIAEGRTGVIKETKSSVFGPGKSGADSANAGLDQSESVFNKDYAYRHPRLENVAQYKRARISLMDEQFALFMSGQNIPYLEAVFQNELQSMDGDVYRTQIAYLNTILLSPIDGIVTGLYKSPGDWVAAGEPVLRVENSDEIYLVGTIIFAGAILNNSPVTVQTNLFKGDGEVREIHGKVVSVRGSSEDDQWDVVMRCKNAVDGGVPPVFPLGYEFDYRYTTVTFS